MTFLVVTCAAMGLLLLADAFLVRRRAAAVSRWAVTEATVTKSTVREIGNATHVEFEYRYVHGGRPYHASRLRWGREGTLVAIPADVALARKSPPGTTIEVRFDPDRPEDACVVGDPGRGAWLRMSLAILLLAGAVAIGWVAYR